MSRYLIPAYVHRAGWAAVKGYAEFLNNDDLDALRDGLTELIAALQRDPAYVLFAPENILDAWFSEDES